MWAIAYHGQPKTIDPQFKPRPSYIPTPLWQITAISSAAVLKRGQERDILNIFSYFLGSLLMNLNILRSVNEKSFWNDSRRRRRRNGKFVINIIFDKNWYLLRGRFLGNFFSLIALLCSETLSLVNFFDKNKIEVIYF